MSALEILIRQLSRRVRDTSFSYVTKANASPPDAAFIIRETVQALSESLPESVVKDARALFRTWKCLQAELSVSPGLMRVNKVPGGSGAQQIAAVRLNIAPVTSSLMSPSASKMIVAPRWTVALAGPLPGSVALWDASRASPVALLTGHTKRLSHLHSSPSCTTLVSASHDGSVRVYRGNLQPMATASATMASSDNANPVTLFADLSPTTARAKAKAPFPRRASEVTSPTSLSVLEETAPDTEATIPVVRGELVAQDVGWVRSLAVLPDGSVAIGTWTPEIKVYTLKSLSQSQKPRHESLVPHLEDANVVSAPPPPPPLSGSIRPGTSNSSSSSSTPTYRSPIDSPASGTPRFPSSHPEQINADMAETLSAMHGSPAIPPSTRSTLGDRRNMSSISSLALDVYDSDPVIGTHALTLAGHTNSVSAMRVLLYPKATNPDTHVLVTGSADKSLRVWDVGSGQELAVGHGHSNGILTVTVVPGFSLAVTGSWDCTLRVWSLESCMEDLAVPGSTPGTAAANPEFKSKELESSLVFTGHTGAIEDVVTIGCRILASASADRTLRLWSLESGDCLGVLAGHSAALSALIPVPLSAVDVLSASDPEATQTKCVGGEGAMGTLNVDGVGIVSLDVNGAMLTWRVDGLEAALSGAAGRKTSNYPTQNLTGGRGSTGAGPHERRPAQPWHQWRSGSRLTAMITTHQGLIVTGYESGHITAWGTKDLTGGSDERENGDVLVPIAHLRGHAGTIDAISQDSAGRLVTVSGVDHTLRVWSAVRQDRIVDGVQLWRGGLCQYVGTLPGWTGDEESELYGAAQEGSVDPGAGEEVPIPPTAHDHLPEVDGPHPLHGEVGGDGHVADVDEVDGAEGGATDGTGEEGVDGDNAAEEATEAAEPEWKWKVMALGDETYFCWSNRGDRVGQVWNMRRFAEDGVEPPTWVTAPDALTRRKRMVGGVLAWQARQVLGRPSEILSLAALARAAVHRANVNVDVGDAPEDVMNYLDGAMEVTQPETELANFAGAGWVIVDAARHPTSGSDGRLVVAVTVPVGSSGEDSGAGAGGMLRVLDLSGDGIELMSLVMSPGVGLPISINSGPEGMRNVVVWTTQRSVGVWAGANESSEWECSVVKSDNEEVVCAALIPGPGKESSMGMYRVMVGIHNRAYGVNLLRMVRWAPGHGPLNVPGLLDGIDLGASRVCIDANCGHLPAVTHIEWDETAERLLWSRGAHVSVYQWNSKSMV